MNIMSFKEYSLSEGGFMTDMNLENVSGKSWVITYLLKNSFKKFNKIRTGEK
jgi:hypothetical protein